MMWTPLSFIAILVVATSATYKTRRIPNPSPQKIKERFRLFMIVPQIIPVAPKSIITKLYNNCEMNLGNRVSPSETSFLPFTTFPNANPDVLYLLIGFDPDSPQFFRTNGTQVLYELIVNIPGADIAAGDVLLLNVPLVPTPGTGDHRFIYLVYKQPARISVTPELMNNITANSTIFYISDFIEEYGLGNPVAGNFFVSRLTLRDSPAGKDAKYNSCYSDCA